MWFWCTVFGENLFIFFLSNIKMTVMLNNSSENKLMFKKATHKSHEVLYPVCGAGQSEVVSIACIVYGVVDEGDPLLDVVGYEEVSRVLHHLVLSLSHVQHGAGGIMAQHLSQATS